MHSSEVCETKSRGSSCRQHGKPAGKGALPTDPAGVTSDREVHNMWHCQVALRPSYNRSGYMQATLGDSLRRLSGFDIPGRC